MPRTRVSGQKPHFLNLGQETSLCPETGPGAGGGGGWLSSRAAVGRASLSVGSVAVPEGGAALGTAGAREVESGVSVQGTPPGKPPLEETLAL